MDSRLLKAAREGDVATLDSLFEEDPLILDRVALSGIAGTPLHIASLAGKTEFVKEILRLNPSFAWELNPDGYSPLHLASANGYIEIVKELLKLGPQLCLIKDKARRNPLHFAAMKGRVNVIAELISCSRNCVKQLTTQGENPLHLAVKNKQFEAVKTMLEKLKDDDEDDIGELINAKDSEGNTILQLAMATEQLQVIELLRNESQVEQDMGITEVGSSSVQVLLLIALISMMITYITLSAKMSPSGLALLIVYLITIAIFVYCALAIEFVKKILHSKFDFAAGKVGGMAKALVKKRKPTSASADALKLDA